MPTPQEQQAQNTVIARVRELRNQISFWNTQYANDPVTNNTAPSTIDSLQRELNGIPNSGNW